MHSKNVTQKILDSLRRERDADSGGRDALGAWFLGPRGEGQELLSRLIVKALDDATGTRMFRYPDDPPWANADSDGYRQEARRIEGHLLGMMDRLSKYSIPFQSYRYQGHMNWDVSLPAVAAYFGAMLYNQNNAAAEGGPVTTALEVLVAEDLCNMIGFALDKDVSPWGHITCGGSVANIEALWAARNVKLFSFIVWEALREDKRLTAAKGLTVKFADGNSRKFVDQSWWDILNIPAQELLSIPKRLVIEVGIEEEVVDESLREMDRRSVKHLGLGRFADYFDEAFEAAGNVRRAIKELTVLAPASIHYSLPKATTLLGLGTQGVVPIEIRPNGRMDTDDLRRRLEERRKEQLPVMAVVAVLGTTQESAVDDLEEILKIRESSREEGLDFWIHADAAWGGYFASLLRRPTGRVTRDLLERAEEKLKEEKDAEFSDENAGYGAALALKQLAVAEEEDGREGVAVGFRERMAMTPEISLSRYVQRQLERLCEADSVTLDPHKSGFVPYPAGAVCYRDERMPEMIRITAPIVYHEGAAETVGVYGIEGSKPGASPAAVYLQHRIIRLDQGGHGKVLGRCAFNARRLYAELATMESKWFASATLQPLEEDEKSDVKKWCSLSNRELWNELRSTPGREDLFRAMGPDLNINTFAVNPMVPDGNGGRMLNGDPALADEFNLRVFRALSLEYEGDDTPPIIITGSKYEGEAASGPAFQLRRQLKISPPNHLPMTFLIATTMNPWMSDADGGRRNMVREVADHLRQAIESEVKHFWRDQEWSI